VPAEDSEITLGKREGVRLSGLTYDCSIRPILEYEGTKRRDHWN
jgi:hypothetical protein